jgi:FkbH-like protein
LTEGEIKEKLESPSHFTLAATLSDGYGEYGVIGLVIARLDEKSETATIEVFLLSCRALGREVERYLMDETIRELSGRGISTVRGIYIRTSRNEQVSSFYAGLGFKEEASSVCADEATFTMVTNEYQSSELKLIEVVRSGCGVN